MGRGIEVKNGCYQVPSVTFYRPVAAFAKLAIPRTSSLEPLNLEKDIESTVN